MRRAELINVTQRVKRCTGMYSIQVNWGGRVRDSYESLDADAASVLTALTRREKRCIGRITVRRSEKRVKNGIWGERSSRGF